MDTLDEELYFLILQYLREGPCKEAAKTLKKEVEKHRLLPKRIDWEGNNYPRAYDELVSTHPHIAVDHLKRICSRIPSLLDDKFPPSVRGVQSLLGAGSQSLLRSEKTAGARLRPSSYLYSQYGELLPLPNNLQHRPHFLRCIQGSEYTGIRRSASTQPVELYKNYQLQRRFVGHLLAVYCVLYDRTGDFIFTGCDDNLVKIWSALSGRLLVSLRGHEKEIVDLAVNYENTMLASGSCDKTVRIWCLKTTVCLEVLHGHTSTVTSLNFCPLAETDWRFLVSTGEDATVCFWHYSKVDKTFEKRPIKMIERSRTGVKMLCSSFSPGGLFLATGSSDSVIRIYRLFRNCPEKIVELEAHTGEVDSIRYSNHSGRFISGSKDGTARIWRQMRNEWLSLLLDMKTKPGQGSPSSSEPLKVNMVEWTADDQFVLTAVSDFSVRVWSSTTGAPIRSLDAHDDDVYVIECTPFNSNLVVTSSHDGRVILWDIATGKVLMNYFNMIDGQGFGAVFDCKWSPHGHSFTATDSHGHIMRFGVGINERFSEDKIPTELYFHTDYRPLIRDDNGYVQDEIAPGAIHLLPPPFLVDVNGAPHPPRFQRLVPGREHLPERYLIPELNDLPNGEREVNDQLIPRELLYPNVHSNTSQSASHIPSSAQSSTNNAPSSSQHSTSHISGAQQADSTSTDSNREDAAGLVENIAAAGDMPVLHLKKVIPEMAEMMLKVLEMYRQAVTEREQERFTNEMKKRPFRDGEQPTASSDSLYTRTRRRPSNYRTRAVRRSQAMQEGEQAVRNRLTTRALYDTDVESSSSSASGGSGGSDASSSEDEDGPAVRPTRARRRPVVHDGMQSDGGSYTGSTSCNDSGSSTSDSDWEGGSATLSTSRVGKGKAKATRRIRSSSDEASEKVSPRKVERKTANDRALRASQRAKLKADEYQDNEPLPPQTPFQTDSWLTTDIPRRSPYFPQIHDEVMYFYQGHKDYVKEVHKRHLYTQPSQFPWDKVPKLKEKELVRVTKIKYIVKPLVKVCQLKLAVLFPETKKKTGTEFSVTYHDMANSVDFLILSQFYQVSVEREWNEGDRFKTIIDDKWYSGTIAALEPVDPVNHPNSPFNCYKVVWEDGSVDAFSPWDLEPADDDQEYVTDITEQEKEALLYVPTLSDWEDRDPKRECLRISNCIAQLMEHSISDEFNAPVDLDNYPDYVETVAYGMDLSTIKYRLTSGFYRRLKAVQSDMRYIESNARLFNRENHPVVRHAKMVTDVCLKILSDDSCEDARQYLREMEDEFACSVDSGIQSIRKKSRRRAGESYDWKSAAVDLVQLAFDHECSEYFRFPPNMDELPGYREAVEFPMDFTTIKERLETDGYTDPEEFRDDIKLIFANSKKYNSRHTPAYKMGVRLFPILSEELKVILARHQSQPVRPKRKASKRSYRELPDDPLLSVGIEPSRNSRRARRAYMAVASTSASTSNGPSTSGASTSGTASTSGGASTSGTSRYSTRSATGTRKLKLFDENFCSGEDIGSFIQVRDKPKRPKRRVINQLVSSEDEGQVDENQATSQTRSQAIEDGQSDYDKDTDAEEEVGAGSHVEDDEEIVDNIFSDEEEVSRSESRHARRESKRPLKASRTYGSRTNGHSQNNGHGHSTRKRVYAGTYREDSDTNDSGDEYSVRDNANIVSGKRRKQTRR